ncbi:hypothetical protein AUK40_06175 [Candidatus Wirthbacteria bacterium CG2_30_54_11]|uniref:2-dehydropantoate 2-reductase n=1 Tax=Candidatus Wirthbacteria bacterium CG2_30_54_11 TaxID=1817892 RepID=A0A1J5IVP1_9BACT|nr:MAG: hypothetical protein AUK40_06175 [Candidatus Wirthbacteria bacterium CG2_30_54_11]
MKIFIIGAGGVGGYFGGKLAHAGLDVTFVARGAHYEAMKTRGLEVRTTEGDFTVSPVQVISKVSEIAAPDLILITCKSYDLVSVAHELDQVVLPSTVVLTTQNGIDNDLVAARILRQGKVFPGLIHIVSERLSPGVISQTGGLRRITFGERGQSSNAELTAIETMMTKAGVRAVASDDIVRDLWKKYAMIIPWAGVTSYSRKSIDLVLSDPALRELFCSSLREALSVAEEAGVHLPDGTYGEIVSFAEKTAPGSRSSMLVDIENGRLTEVETLHGTLLKLAQEHGIETPVNEMIYRAIKEF